MFELSYSTPCPSQGELVFDHQPWSLGYHTDIHGNKWDIRGYFGKRNKAGEMEAYVQACLVEQLHPYFRDTSNQQYGVVQQSWLPYKVKVVGK